MEQHKLLLLFLLICFMGIFVFVYYQNQSTRENSIGNIIHQSFPIKMAKLKFINFLWGVEEEKGKNERQICPLKAPGLNGTIRVDLESPEIGQIEAEYPDVELGGHWKPKECRARHKVALILPYRNREKHLRGFLHHMHRFLQSQQLDYAIFVIEEWGQLTFNRGRLLNIGYLESKKFYGWECFVLHDIDALPENNLNIYSCPENPNIVKHMAVGFEKHGYKILYDAYFSGSLIFSDDGFRRVNGYSNDYWGWGGEDDDLYKRVNQMGMNITRNSDQIARYKQLDHKPHEKGSEINPCRFKLLDWTKSRQPIDGLNSLHYEVKSIEFNRLYTHIKVDLLDEELKEFEKNFKKQLNC